MLRNDAKINLHFDSFFSSLSSLRKSLRSLGYVRFSRLERKKNNFAKENKFIYASFLNNWCVATFCVCCVLLSASCGIFKSAEKPDYGSDKTKIEAPKPDIAENESIYTPVSKPEPVTKPSKETMDTIEWTVIDPFKGKKMERPEVKKSPDSDREEEEVAEKEGVNPDSNREDENTTDVPIELKAALDEIMQKEAALDEKIAKAEVRHADKKLSDGQLLAIREETQQKRFELERARNEIIGEEEKTLNEDEIVKIETEAMTKNNYTVVIMMPFLTNQFTSFDPIPSKSKRALEFYEGAKMALADLQSQGVPMTVYVFDTQYSEHVVQSLLNSGPLFEADLIIGPVTKKNCELVANFGRMNNKVVVSPYNYVSVVEQNPFYVQVNPSVQTQYVRLMEYITKTFGSTNNAIIFAPAGKRAVDQRIQQIQNASGMTGSGQLRLHTFSVMAVNEESMEADRFLIAGQNNIVIIPSRDPGFVAYCMRELNPFRRSHKVTVIGMPQWEDEKFEKVDYNYYDNLRLTVGSESYINPDNFKVRNFIGRYASEYGTKPSENVFKGYDIMYYFGEMLKEHGIYFPTHLAKSPKQSMHTTFKFEPIYGGLTSDGKPAITRFENSYINILQFEDFEFIDVTPY